jgi:ParD-like antitoxin of type II ParDE toxin-antitoxin system
LTFGSLLLPYHLMSQPVKVSDALILDARLTGEVNERSIAGQIEFWAKLGRAIEPLLRGEDALALCKAGASRPLSACLRSVDSPEGRRRVAEHLKTNPFPHYEVSRDAPGFLVRIEADGKRTVGRFVNRQFHVVKAARKSGTKAPRLAGSK